jgi:biopolymer transport protein ExbD/biopolymer transport protein TolR
MAKSTLHKHKQVICEINITPLTDVFLVLLTIMMIVAPFMRQVRGDIHLPEITSGSEIAKDQVTVDVSKEGTYFINSVEVSPQTLGEILREKASRLEVKKMVVQADRDTKSKAVLEVFRAAEDAGFEKLTVVGQAANMAQEKKRDETDPPTTVR